MIAMDYEGLIPVYAADIATFLDEQWDTVAQTLGARLLELAQALQQAAGEIAENLQDKNKIERAVDPVAKILMEYPNLWERLTQYAKERRLPVGSEVLQDGEPLPTIPNRFEKLAQRAQETLNRQQAQSPPNETHENADEGS